MYVCIYIYISTLIYTWFPVYFWMLIKKKKTWFSRFRSIPTSQFLACLVLIPTYVFGHQYTPFEDQTRLWTETQSTIAAWGKPTKGTQKECPNYDNSLLFAWQVIWGYLPLTNPYYTSFQFPFCSILTFDGQLSHSCSHGISMEFFHELPPPRASHWSQNPYSADGSRQSVTGLYHNKRVIWRLASCWVSHINRKLLIYYFWLVVY